MCERGGVHKWARGVGTLLTGEMLTPPPTAGFLARVGGGSASESFLFFWLSRLLWIISGGGRDGVNGP